MKKKCQHTITMCDLSFHFFVGAKDYTKVDVNRVGGGGGCE